MYHFNDKREIKTKRILKGIKMRRNNLFITGIQFLRLEGPFQVI